MSESLRAVGRLRTALKLDISPSQAWRQDITTVLAELERVTADNAHLRAEKAIAWGRVLSTSWWQRILTFLTRRRP